jgi:transcriptional regulator with XRE-family HTH domain
MGLGRGRKWNREGSPKKKLNMTPSSKLARLTERLPALGEVKTLPTSDILVENFLVGFNPSERFCFRVSGGDGRQELYNDDDVLFRRLRRLIEHQEPLTRLLGAQLRGLRERAGAKQSSMQSMLKGSESVSHVEDQRSTGDTDRWPISQVHVSAVVEPELEEDLRAAQSYLSKVETGRKRLMLDDVRKYLALLGHQLEYAILDGDKPVETVVNKGSVEVGEVLVALRERAGLTQGDLAARINRTQSAISKMLLRQNLAIDEVRNLLHGMGYSLRIGGRAITAITSSSTITLLNERLSARVGFN